MKYKLINTKTKEEHLCEKVTIDGFDYYVSDDKILNGDYCIHPTTLNISQHSFDNNLRLYWKKVIATTNLNIDIPQVVDELDVFAVTFTQKELKEGGIIYEDLHYGFIEGYNKSQETHPFSEEDTLDFLQFYKDTSRLDFNSTGEHHGKSPKEILEIWKSKKPKIVYYESN